MFRPKKRILNVVSKGMCRMLNIRIKPRRVAQKGEYREVGLFILWQEEGFGKMKVYLGKAVYL